LLILQDNPDQSCMAADAIARARLDEVVRRIDILVVLKAELQRMIAECSRGRVGECRAIQIVQKASWQCISLKPDSLGGRPRALDAHTAFHYATAAADVRPRDSIEIRALALF
jgi:hypothetical protein